MRTILFIALLCSVTAVNAQLFTQNFESSTVLSDYYNPSPGSNQFDLIDNTGADMLISISSGRLTYSRTGTKNGSFSKISDLASSGLISIKFDLEVSGNLSAATTAATFQVGSDFGSNNTLEANSRVHSKIGINILGSEGQFSLRNIAAGQSSTVFSGNQTVTWVINNTGSSHSYLTPAGGSETVGDDKYDLWIGSTRVFDEGDATTATQVPSDFKFLFNGGNATISFDNILISELTSLPVSLTAFSARRQGRFVELNWETSSELNSDAFDVLRAVEKGGFSRIARLSPGGLTGKVSSYSFLDQDVIAGQRYYQLLQRDKDGHISRSEIIQVAAEEAPEPFFSSLAVRPESVNLRVSSSVTASASLYCSDLSGKVLAVQHIQLRAGANEISLPVKESGILIITCVVEGRTQSVKLMK